MIVSAPSAESDAMVELGAAVERVGLDDLPEALQRVAGKLPVAAGVETVSIRIRDSDAEGSLHLVATEGIPANDRRSPVFFTQTVAQARSLFVLRTRHSLPGALGFTWLQGHWIEHDGEPLGTITVGSRTERRPTPEQIGVLQDVATRLGPALEGIDRRKATLEAITRAVVRASLSAPVEAPARVARLLRPRELTVLALYSEGLSALEIADAFVISPHTVRTHIKNAYRRLGVHTREEAARLIHDERVSELV
jgi:DNA-binding CsgD family transcriptional regulator